jgi:hypothetical protein
MTTNTQMQRFMGGIEQGFKDVVHATGAFTLGIYDALTLVDTSTGTIGNITLPNTVPVGTAREHSILDIGGQANANPITILAPGGGTINGAASLTINEPYGGVTLLTKDGLNYKTPTSSAGVIGPSNAVYVDPAGNDATGTRGNFAFPFLTVEGGMAACQQGDELLIAPGLYQPLVALTPPVGVTELVIRGSGRVVNTDPAGLTYFGGTMITDANLPGSNVFDFINVMDYALIAELTVVCTLAGFNFDGSSSAGLYGLNGIYVQNCRGQLNAQDVNILRWEGGQISGQCVITTCADVIFEATRVDIGCVVNWDDNDANKPTTARGDVVFQASSVSGVLDTGGQASVTGDTGSAVGGIEGNTLSVANGLALSLRWYGRVTGTIDFSTGGKELPDSATACVLDFDGSLLLGTPIKFKVAGAPPTHAQTVSMRNATVTGAAAVITADSDIVIDATGATLGSGVTTVNAGTPAGTMTLEVARSETGTPTQLTSADKHVWQDTSAGNRTIRVPLTMMKGWRCRVQKNTTDANTITIARNGFAGKIQQVAGDYTWALSGAATYPWIDLSFDGVDLWVQ